MSYICDKMVGESGSIRKKAFTSLSANQARRGDFSITRLYLYETIKTGLSARPPRNKVNVPPTRAVRWAVLAEIEFVTRGNNWNRWSASFRLQCPFLYQLVDPVITGIADLQDFDPHASGSNLHTGSVADDTLLQNLPLKSSICTQIAFWCSTKLSQLTCTTKTK